MLDLEVCVGSACHVRGSYAVISKLQELISDSDLDDKVQVKAAFCFGHCTEPVSVHFAEEDPVYSVAPDSASVKAFFETEILKRVNAQ